MKPNRRTRAIWGLMITVFAMGSCQTVKEYQKQHLNDAEMELSARKVQKFETNFQSYREAASGANGGKTGGGCGCN
jgi:hypothetical protein